jgi:hypothetical protein
MVTIGLSIVLEGAAGVIWGTDTKEFHHAFRRIEEHLPSPAIW